MKLSSVKLRQEVFQSDAYKIIDWMEDEEVTKYLNERQNVGKSIRQVIYRLNMPILTHVFNQNGSFFMITTNQEESIGFLRLVPKERGAEIVVVIGEKEIWGKGLGPNAIIEGLKHAFFEWRVNEVIAKIRYDNVRSIKAFEKVGFTRDRELAREIQYSICMKRFLEMVA
ncbi:GNAT family N-acetyltransferase [Clostridium thermosuccinogenes]|jgi:RimJ/RimL family protein N-acetyltransferase|uniref:GNAT family N-acetyltransferase n=1 Tax=Clostridium thermosuccinogenes TaxID=84032 RepID=A0A2K2F618_9CLOT|nr:GNAT family protein [Pseudoclostridium thermosuccinogenes]AUS97943.1 GNAT family N-acetyltransferase [Pseudoclostridium thermosuccinogenes]PNT94233.1 GNAT family N-acetyltransferase [Pseudoclostridium thermosuccinogenes]PNU00240.1 GNAT family N-acetyltransferase [Pseudoclostridium thermosuccinogenes]PNU01564.1 GNAT family N-acetyltransferase [Pseudoclostridium thermosuccinogenes]